MADVLIVGAGAAGLMAAGAAARRGHAVTVLEHTGRPAQKLLVTGKGRQVHPLMWVISIVFLIHFAEAPIYAVIS